MPYCRAAQCNAVSQPAGWLDNEHAPAWIHTTVKSINFHIFHPVLHFVHCLQSKQTHARRRYEEKKKHLFSFFAFDSIFHIIWISGETERLDAGNSRHGMMSKKEKNKCVYITISEEDADHTTSWQVLFEANSVARRPSLFFSPSLSCICCTHSGSSLVRLLLNSVHHSMRAAYSRSPFILHCMWVRCIFYFYMATFFILLITCHPCRST